MKIGLHVREFSGDTLSSLLEVIRQLLASKVHVYLPERALAALPKDTPLLSRLSPLEVIHNTPLDFIFSIGGDGALLDALPFTYKQNIPILGINTGRIGFLASVPKEEIEESIQACLAGRYDYDTRSTITLSGAEALFGDMHFALNECTILRRDVSSLIGIRCFLDEKLLNTYWADGIIVSTPTGSTAYSMSCGGPLLMPQSKNFVITPINSHNLAARPLVIPDDSEITFEVEGHEKEVLVSLDARTATLLLPTRIKVRKHAFCVKLVTLKEHNFIDSLHGKLNWGLDKRN